MSDETMTWPAVEGWQRCRLLLHLAVEGWQSLTYSNYVGGGGVDGLLLQPWCKVLLQLWRGAIVQLLLQLWSGGEDVDFCSMQLLRGGKV